MSSVIIFPDFVLSCDAEYQNICLPPSPDSSQWDVITFMKLFKVFTPNQQYYSHHYTPSYLIFIYMFYLTSVFLPGKLHGQREAWQATVHGVEKSWTRRKAHAPTHKVIFPPHQLDQIPDPCVLQCRNLSSDGEYLLFSCK